MSAISNCLAKLVKAGKISQRIADQAQAIDEGLQPKLGKALDLPSAEAASALETARILAEGARQKKLRLTRMMQGAQRIDERMMAHGYGPDAGLISMLVKDIHGQGGLNVTAQTENIEGAIYERGGKGFQESYKSKAGGFAQDNAGARNTILEMRGKDTGDALAKENATLLKQAIDYGMDRLQKAGIFVPKRDQWYTPQFWTAERLRQFGKPAWLKDMRAEIDAGNLRVLDKDTGKPVEFTKREAILERAWKDITTGSEEPLTAGLRGETRTFEFADPDAYGRLMDKYGPGENGYFGMMQRYTHSLSRETAFAELMGPEWRAEIRNRVSRLREAAKDGTYTAPFTGDAKPYSARNVITEHITGPTAVERTYQYMTGALNSQVEHNVINSGMSWLRALMTAAKLGSATVSALPGDTATSAMTASMIGMGTFRGTMSVLRDPATTSSVISRMGLIAHSIMDNAGGMRRFENDMQLRGLPASLAQKVIRNSGLVWWTDVRKATWTVDHLGWLTDHADKSMGQLHPLMRQHLEADGGFKPADWDAIRSAPKYSIGGAEFLDIASLDQNLADRVRGLIIDTRQRAIIEPDARIRGLLTGGQRQGTLGREILNNAFLFKSFTMSLTLDHIYQNWVRTQGVGGKLARLAQLVTLSTLAGAVSLEARALLTGKDVRNPFREDGRPSAQFVWDSMLYGGGLGAYGDMIDQMMHPDQNKSALGFISGPSGQFFGDTAKFGIDTASNWYAGKDQHFGRRTAAYLRNYTPGGNLWYARLMTDRYLYDNIQMLLDPDYAQGFQREKDRLRQRGNQEFWFAPGTYAPQRAPQIGQPIPTQ